MQCQVIFLSSNIMNQFCLSIWPSKLVVLTCAQLDFFCGSIWPNKLLLYFKQHLLHRLDSWISLLKQYISNDISNISHENLTKNTIAFNKMHGATSATCFYFRFTFKHFSLKFSKTAPDRKNMNQILNFLVPFLLKPNGFYIWLYI